MNRTTALSTSASVLLALLTACVGDRSGDSAALETCDTASWEDTGIQVGTLDGACRCDAPIIEIGTGTAAFEPLAPGASVEMVHGPQGGWHITGALRAINTRNVVTILANVTVGGVPVTEDLQYRVQLVNEGDCSGSFPNLTLYLDATHLAEGERDSPPEILPCQEALISMCVTDTGGRDQCADLEVFVLPDPDDVEAGLSPSCD